MGSFAYTCTVSGLPIEAGTPVRYLLLGEDLYHRGASNTCYTTDRWYPRCFPVRAEYNDYGSVENFQQPFLRDLMFDSFRHDVVERGTGDNSCHDVPVRKGMPIDEWLNAIWEGRVLVRESPLISDSDKELGKKLGIKRKIPPEVPTRKRVEKSLIAAGFKIGQDRISDSGYLVDRLRYGFIRVRAATYSDPTKALAQAQNALQHFATMVTIGSGHYCSTAELLVAPKPAKDTHIFFASIRTLKNRGRRLIPIAQAMVREDVWQLLCSLSAESLSFTKVGLKILRRDVAEFWDHTVKAKEKDEIGKLLIELHFSNSNLAASFLSNRPTLGHNLKNAWHDAVQMGVAEENLADFLDTVAETLHVQQVLSSLRYQWQPGTSCGPQFGEWSMHRKWLRGLAKIAKKELDEREEDY